MTHHTHSLYFSLNATKIARRLAVTLAAGAILSSCADEQVIPEATGRAVSYIPVICTQDEASRSDADSDCRYSEVTSVSEIDSLYLHTRIISRKEEISVSRSEPVEQMSDYGSFGVFAYVYNGPWVEAAEYSTPDYMYNVRVRQQGEVWAPVSEYLWPLAECNIRFYAYAPYNCAGAELPSISMVGEPELHYQEPSAATSQKDLLVASTPDIRGGANHEPASLTFSHALTAVRFVSGDGMLPGIIRRITISGVAGSGTYSWASGKWTVDESTTSYTITVDKEMDGTANAEIIPEDHTLMLMPQTLPEGAQIEIAFADDVSGVTHLLKASIAGSIWPEGHVVEYRLSTESVIVTPYFTVTPPAEFSYTGGKSAYTVDSRLDVVAADEQPLRNLPVEWMAQFSEDDGLTWSDLAPDWLTEFTASGSGNKETPAKFSAEVRAQQGTIHNIHNINLRATRPLSATYDLSTAGGTEPMSTANCYIVNAPGRYSLPLVYGNAIKNGSPNPSAYTTANPSTSASLLRTFVNHLESEIIDPYIYNNPGCTPADAVLVWQDGASQISNVRLSSDRRRLLFNVESDNIMQGNAVVAVRDAGKNIMWSWHIWVTDYRLGDDLDEIVNFQGTAFTLLPYAIGWCDSENINYEGRKVKVRFIQRATGQEQIITIVQKDYQLRNCSNQSYFQWGRKDPMLGGNVIVGDDNMTDKQCYYDYDEYVYSSAKLTQATIPEAIRTPFRQYCAEKTGARLITEICGMLITCFLLQIRKK